jgi:L-asparaginase
VSPPETEALAQAHAAGVVVMMSSRAGSGRVFNSSKIRDAGFLTADNLTPQKARILLSLALTKTKDPAEIRRIFATY